MQMNRDVLVSQRAVRLSMSVRESVYSPRALNCTRAGKSGSSHLAATDAGYTVKVMYLDFGKASLLEGVKKSSKGSDPT